MVRGDTLRYRNELTIALMRHKWHGNGNSQLQRMQRNGFEVFLSNLWMARGEAVPLAMITQFHSIVCAMVDNVLTTNHTHCESIKQTKTFDAALELTRSWGGDTPNGWDFRSSFLLLLSASFVYSLVC